MEEREVSRPPRAAVGIVVLFSQALLTQVIWFLASPASQLAAQEPLLCERFDTVATPGLWFPAQNGGNTCTPAPAAAAAGENAACIDPLERPEGESGEGRLVLTNALDHQVGTAWVQEGITLADTQVRVELDFYMAGGSNPPADGLSIVFHEGDSPISLGRGGGALGLAGLPRGFVSVGFDVWDNGEHDPEGACDGPSARTCHAEINHSCDPEVQASLAVSTDVPNFAAAGAAGVPIQASVTLNGRELILVLTTAFEGYGSREVFRTLLPPDPFGAEAQEIHVGLTAATGSANTQHSIDNLCVWTSPLVAPVVEVEQALERGGLNCGGPAVSAMVDGAFIEFAADGAYNSIVTVVPGPPGKPTRFIRRGHGWISTGDWQGKVFDTEVMGLPDPTLQPVFATEASSPVGLRYRHNVLPGRYALTLYAAENCPCGLDKHGNATRRYDVRLQGQDALLFFSPAEAAARAWNVCNGLLGTAVVRRFEVDAREGSDATYLEIEVDDLGGGAPPENAQLNGYHFVRLGEPLGEPLTGEIEDSRPSVPETFGDPQPFLDLDWNAIASGSKAAEALQGTATATWRSPGPFFVQFQPLIIDGRLRLADDTRLASASAVIFDRGGAGVFDPLSSKLAAVFDVFITNAAGKPPADGLVFALIEGSNPNLLGTAGGALGLTGVANAAIGVEIDLWEGGGEGDDSGFNTDGQGHIAVVGSGGGPASVDHVQDQNDFDPALDGPGWVNWLATTGYRVEVDYSPEARVVVHLSALDGSFPRRKVLDTLVTPFTSHQAMLGFFAATGGETATMEVDNFKVLLSACEDSPEIARIVPDAPVRLSLSGLESVELDLDGSSSTTGVGSDSSRLEYHWSVTGPDAGAELAATCQAQTRAIFRLPGEYRVTLQVDDRECGTGPSGTAQLLVRVAATDGALFVRSDTNCDAQIDISDAVSTLSVLFLGIGVICCDDAADSNDDGFVDITDPVVTLNYLFLGGTPPFAPFPDCGSDATDDDTLECAGEAACP